MKASTKLEIFLVLYNTIDIKKYNIYSCLIEEEKCSNDLVSHVDQHGKSQAKAPHYALSVQQVTSWIHGVHKGMVAGIHRQHISISHQF